VSNKQIMPQHISGIEIGTWIGSLGFVLSLVNIYRSIGEKKVKLNADIGFSGDVTNIIIYNNSSRRVTIQYFKIYMSKSKYLTKRHYIRTLYDEGEDSHFPVEPYERTTLQLQGQNSIPKEFITHGVLFLKVYVPGNIRRTIRLRA